MFAVQRFLLNPSYRDYTLRSINSTESYLISKGLFLMEAPVTRLEGEWVHFYGNKQYEKEREVRLSHLMFIINN